MFQGLVGDPSKSRMENNSRRPFGAGITDRRCKEMMLSDLYIYVGISFSD